MYTVEGSSTVSFHMRSSPGICAATTLGGVKKVSPRFLELVAVIPGASVRLLRARFGIAELLGSGPFTAMSASPPPGATPGLLGRPTLLTQPPTVKPKMPQLSGWPSYLKSKATLELVWPLLDLFLRQ